LLKFEALREDISQEKSMTEDNTQSPKPQHEIGAAVQREFQHVKAGKATQAEVEDARALLNATVDRRLIGRLPQWAQNLLAGKRSETLRERDNNNRQKTAGLHHHFDKAKLQRETLDDSSPMFRAGMDRVQTAPASVQAQGEQAVREWQQQMEKVSHEPAHGDTAAHLRPPPHIRHKI
jgi:hypothetical protein